MALYMAQPEKSSTNCTDMNGVPGRRLFTGEPAELFKAFYKVQISSDLIMEQDDCGRTLAEVR